MGALFPEPFTVGLVVGFGSNRFDVEVLFNVVVVRGVCDFGGPFLLLPFPESDVDLFFLLPFAFGDLVAFEAIPVDDDVSFKVLTLRSIPAILVPWISAIDTVHFVLHKSRIESNASLRSQLQRLSMVSSLCTN